MNDGVTRNLSGGIYGEYTSTILELKIATHDPRTKKIAGSVATVVVSILLL